MKDLSDKIASDEEVGKRIAARYAAEVLAQLADEEAKEHGNHFWKCLHDICCAHVFCKEEQAKADRKHRREMTDGEVQRFGLSLIPFRGEFQGKKVSDVPLERLQWYADQTFIDELRRYLRSERIKMEISQHENQDEDADEDLSEVW